jgi:hypothetical protein
MNDALKIAPRVIDSGRARHADPVISAARKTRTVRTLDARGPDNVAPKSAIPGHYNPRWAPVICLRGWC